MARVAARITEGVAEEEQGAAPPALALHDLAKSYRSGEVEVPALRGVSFEVGAGELVALVGPSGSGKSTLLHLCGLLDAPDRGRLFLAGQEVSGLGARELTFLRRDLLGFVFQGFHLVPVLTAAENVELPLLYAGVRRRERTALIEAALQAVGLAGLGHRRPDALSGGQRQRVAIARALVRRPRLVLADEPTANLDSETAAQVIDVMRDLARAGGTAFLVATHDERMAAHCHRKVALVDGRLS